MKLFKWPSRSLVVAVALVVLVPAIANAQIEGLYFVRADPDTEELWWGPIQRPVSFCPWAAPSPGNPGFQRADILDEEADCDVDLLVSDALHEPPRLFRRPAYVSPATTARLSCSR